MKALVLGDVHGNLVALENVLKKYSSEVDIIISHGDVVNYGPWSNECVQLLNDSKAVCLKGNHEEAYIMGYYPGENNLVQEFFKHTYKEFNQLEIISAYGESFKVGEYTILHTINDSYYYPDSDLRGLNLKGNIIIGHSHYAFHKQTPSGKTLSNTGSIGQNRKQLNVSNFILLDSEKNSLEIKSEIYNTDLLLSEMRNQRYPQSCLNYYKNKL